MATNPATPTERMTGVGLAGGLVVSALLDTLHAKGILTVEESRNVLDAALASVGPCANPAKGSKRRKLSDCCALDSVVQSACRAKGRWLILRRPVRWPWSTP
jgi:hypothetical protein